MRQVVSDCRSTVSTMAEGTRTKQIEIKLQLKWPQQCKKSQTIHNNDENNGNTNR